MKQVSDFDIEATNGVVHIVDHVFWFVMLLYHISLFCQIICMLFGANLCFLSIWPILPDFLALFVQLCRPGSGKGKYCFQIANSQFWRIKNSSILSSANSIEILCIFPLPFSDWSEVVLKVLIYLISFAFYM